MTSRLVELGPDDALFADWCAVWAAASLAERPDEPPRPAADHVAIGRELLTAGGSRTGTHRAAVVDGAVAGALRLILPTRDNTTVAIVDVAVHPAHRRRGLGSALLAEGLALAAAHGRTVAIADVDEPAPDNPGRAFAQRHDWSCDLLETRRDLDLPVPEDRLAALEAEAAAAGAGYEIVTWRDRTPDALLEDRALLARRMTTDAPQGDLPVEEEEWDGARMREVEEVSLARGRTVVSAGAVHEGRLVGYTDLQIPLSVPVRAQQAGTLVLREHRGHRLGARMKVAVLRELAASFPSVRRISTYNSESNRPMVAVNEALGFRPAGQFSAWSTRLPGA
ncbi:GNAT family N-acetyltransferase [Blastococcus litoris]|uniref:GNAT family N-acetyltransferase n=1 Tax=Blastococcus litoris TaxID=2171622 RepID=UPI000E306A17|nr:GNAT family N-acetyltransferase [Blastococcus litoris]